MSAGVDVHVVTHTHWDREWYHPASRFRQRLVELIDDLLDNEGRGPVLLDGQTVVLEDYLAVRPERRDALARRLADGSLEAGPWYVLADELLPSGEGLVRNLFAGLRILHSLGAESPPVLYSPDAFGHPAALPTIAAGFGLPLVILWRGLGGEHWPNVDTLRWRAPDGSDALALHLSPAGYGHGSALPTAEEPARQWWEAVRRELADRSCTGLLLVLNGADHHAPRPDVDEAVRGLAQIAEPDRVQRVGLRTFAGALASRASNMELPLIEGELRDSYGYTWTLQGTFASRAAQKRRAAGVERLLTREAEPWSVLATRRGSRSRAPLVRAAWRSLLLCHPHDTYCGCSIDEVARAMDARLDEAESQGRGIVEDVLLEIAEHDRVAARDAPARWQNAVLIRNAAARTRGGVAEVEIGVLRQHVRVGPGSGGIQSTEQPSEVFSLGDGLPLQRLDRFTRHDRIESPEHFPYDDLVDVHRAAVWVDDVPGYGVKVIPVTSAASGEISFEHPEVQAMQRRIANDDLGIEIDSAGAVDLTTVADGRFVPTLVRLEDVGDAGDLYTHSPIEPTLSVDRIVASELVHRGPLRAAMRTAWRIDVPVETARSGRSSRKVPIELRITFEVDAGASFVRVHVEGENTARDHRLRLVFATGITSGVVNADAAFAVVRRERIVVSAEAQRMETPPNTAPLHRYVTVSNDKAGATLFSDGLAEYEVTPRGEIAVTLVRAVGELSRNDLPERPGHAGWPVPTPQAQSLGPFLAHFAIFPHGPRTAATIDAIERAADDALLPLRGTPFRSALSVPAPQLGISLVGEGLGFSTCKDSEDGEWIVLRCVNLLDRPTRGAWRLGAPVREARAARLDETPLSALEVDDGTIRIDVPARAVSTVLTR
ncbi:MAG TPA: glycoside hydrolase family 38 C-terminal domain-containing protein [Gemmatimonadaceae bacterium]|nr:glycoside hydrolase family 38 C-terminal domain-containing protein [Gemmatimonadaceae bacterium]